jgi:hypothetical protein
VVLVFTGVSVAVAEISRGADSVAADVSYVELHQEEGIIRNVGGLLIMPTSKGTQEMVFEGRNAYVNDTVDNFSSNAVTSDSIQSEREPDRFVMSVPMNTWTAGMFRFRTISEQGTKLVSARENGSPSKLMIKNLGDAPVTHAVYISREGVSDLFDLEAGGEQEIDLSKPPASKFSDWYQSRLGKESNEAEVFMDLAAVLDREVGGQRIFHAGFFDHAQMKNTLIHLERPLVLGFVESSPTSLGFKSSLKRRSKTFYVVHL